MASRGYSVVAVFALVIALASLVKHRLQGMQASVAAARGLRVASPRLSSTGSIVVVHEPSCPMVYGILPDKGKNPCLLHWQMAFF